MKLNDVKKTTGVAVFHDRHVTGEVCSEPIQIEAETSYVHVEFGETNRSVLVNMSDLLVDIAYYLDYPEHATPAVVEALAHYYANNQQ